MPRFACSIRPVRGIRLPGTASATWPNTSAWNDPAGSAPVSGRDGDVGQAASYSDGQTHYTRNANQFSFNGPYYFLTAGVKF